MSLDYVKKNLISSVIIMNKNILRNSQFLESLGRKSKGESKSKVDEIIDLYKSRKIAQVQTAENAIKKLISNDGRTVKSGMKLHQKIVSKHQEIPTLSHRLRQKTTLRIEDKVIKNINTGDHAKSKTDIKISLNSVDREDGNHKNFDYIFSTVKRRMTEKVEAMLKAKGNMKIQLTTFYRIKRLQGTTDKDDFYKKNPEQYFHDDKENAWYQYQDKFDNTKAVRVTSNNISDVLRQLKDSINKAINNTIDSWSLDRFFYIVITCYTINPPRAASYIPTPSPYNNPKCGLVNIQNDDNKCFMWCLKYHQSEKLKNGDRVSVLSKLDDRYKYDDIDFPVNQDDIKIFEDKNKISVNVYVIGDGDSINLEYLGNIDYIKNDVVYLLRIEVESQSHYVYIKNIARLLNLNSYTKPDNKKQFCPYCTKNVSINDYFENHLKDCYKRASGEGSLIKLPEEDSFMEFKNHKNKLERPFIVYADCESTLQKIDKKLGDNTKLIHQHNINSCCYYFVCNYDSSKNILKTYEGDDCMEKMIMI
jgi:predicted component of type VI protein secretion system